MKVFPFPLALLGLTLLFVRRDSATVLRDRVLAAAEGELGPGDTDAYWASCKVSGMIPPHWCGCFVLWALHQAGLALNVRWIVGQGFASGLPMTYKPKPGDIAYFSQPFQHHALVVSWDGTTLETIDGNAPGVKRGTRVRPEDVRFYSIEPYIRAANG
jgi:hypothetical protein